jgi:hypothetical protein
MPREQSQQSLGQAKRESPPVDAESITAMLREHSQRRCHNETAEGCLCMGGGKGSARVSTKTFQYVRVFAARCTPYFVTS